MSLSGDGYAGVRTPGRAIRVGAGIAGIGEGQDARGGVPPERDELAREG